MASDKNLSTFMATAAIETEIKYELREAEHRSLVEIGIHEWMHFSSSSIFMSCLLFVVF